MTGPQEVSSGDPEGPAEAPQASAPLPNDASEQAVANQQEHETDSLDGSIREDDFGADDDHFSEVGAASDTEVGTHPVFVSCSIADLFHSTHFSV